MPTSEGEAIREYLVLRELFATILQTHLGGPVPEPEALQAAPLGLSSEHQRWLMLLDLCAAPEALRVGIQKKAPEEKALIVLLRFFTRMGREVDYDRFDWVITYIFRRRLAGGNDFGGAGSIGQQIAEMFPDFPQPPLSDATTQNLTALTKTIEKINAFTTFAQLTESGLIAKGREIKASFSEERFHPAVIAAVVSYNLSFGQRFRRLFDEAADRSRDLAAKLSGGDYRSNVEPMRKLALATSEENKPAAPAAGETIIGGSTAVESTAADPATGSPVFRGPMHDPMAQLGLDEGKQAQKIRFTIRTLAAFYETAENKLADAARVGNVKVSLWDWEIRAVLTDYPDTDRSFRAESARVLKHAVGLVARMAEERDELERKQGSEYLWKPHYDSLIWLLARGRDYSNTVTRLAADCGKRGLPERQQQVQKTCAKLEGALDKVAEVLTAK